MSLVIVVVAVVVGVDPVPQEDVLEDAGRWGCVSGDGVLRRDVRFVEGFARNFWRGRVDDDDCVVVGSRDDPVVVVVAGAFGGWCVGDGVFVDLVVAVGALVLVVVGLGDLDLDFPVLVLVGVVLVEVGRGFDDGGLLLVGGFLAEVEDVVVFAVGVAGVFGGREGVVVVAVAVVALVGADAAVGGGELVFVVGWVLGRAAGALAR